MTWMHEGGTGMTLKTNMSDNVTLVPLNSPEQSEHGNGKMVALVFRSWATSMMAAREDDLSRGLLPNLSFDEGR